MIFFPPPHDFLHGTRRARPCGVGTVARIQGTVRAARLLRGVDDDVVAELAGRCVLRRFSRGQVVWRAGDPSTHVALVVTGIVKIVQRTDDGHDAIVALFGPHETFGELAVVAGGGYSADAVAASAEVEIASIDAVAMRSAVARCPAFARALERHLVEHGRVLQEKIRIMSAGLVEQRIAALVRHLVDRFGDELVEGGAVAPIALSRAEVASLVGATLETTIRTLSLWQKEGIVTVGHEGFVVHDPDRLGAILTARSSCLRRSSTSASSARSR